MKAEVEKVDMAGMLDGMGLDELKGLRKALDRAISNLENRKRKEALSAVEQAARKHGYKLTDLVTDRQAAKAKNSSEGESTARGVYVNPENPDQSWSGRGRRPGWVLAALSAGRTLEELAA